MGGGIKGKVFQLIPPTFKVSSWSPSKQFLLMVHLLELGPWLRQLQEQGKVNVLTFYNVIVKEDKGDVGCG